jgi:hypothetical protein
MRDIVIAPQTEGKGRSFAAVCVGTIEADSLWDGGQTATENMRPVWALFAGSDAELRPFMANLRTGRKAQFIKGTGYYGKKQERLETLRSAGYQIAWQREAEGSLATMYLPEIFQIDPGMVDTREVRFIVLPSVDWAPAQIIDPGPIVQHARKLGGPLGSEEIAALVPLAFLFCAYLDRRTRRPIYSDGRFHMQLLLACLTQGLASWPTDDSYRWRPDREKFGRHSHFQFRQTTTEAARVGEGLAFHATHEQVDTILAEQVQQFFAVIGAP